MRPLKKFYLSLHNLSKQKDLSSDSIQEQLAEMETEELPSGDPRPNSNQEDGTEAEQKDKKKLERTDR